VQRAFLNVLHDTTNTKPLRPANGWNLNRSACGLLYLSSFWPFAVLSSYCFRSVCVCLFVCLFVCLRMQQTEVHFLVLVMLCVCVRVLQSVSYKMRTTQVFNLI